MFVVKLFAEIYTYIYIHSEFHIPGFSVTLVVAFKSKINNILLQNTPPPLKTCMLREDLLRDNILESHANTLAVPISEFLTAVVLVLILVAGYIM
jgi:hypothetical protein